MLCHGVPGQPIDPALHRCIDTANDAADVLWLLGQSLRRSERMIGSQKSKGEFGEQKSPQFHHDSILSCMRIFWILRAFLSVTEGRIYLTKNVLKQNEHPEFLPDARCLSQHNWN